MDSDWLKQLRQIREADQVRRETEVEPKEEVPTARQQANDLLRQSKAHELLRQVQKALLGGQGQLEIFEHKGQYDQVLILVWQGPISAARKPDPDDPAEFSYILVGVRQGTLWVNGKALPEASPAALKAALIEASKNPGRDK